jgi:hypothetical protein
LRRDRAVNALLHMSVMASKVMGAIFPLTLNSKRADGAHDLTPAVKRRFTRVISCVTVPTECTFGTLRIVDCAG